MRRRDARLRRERIARQARKARAKRQREAGLAAIDRIWVSAFEMPETARFFDQVKADAERVERIMEASR